MRSLFMSWTRWHPLLCGTSEIKDTQAWHTGRLNILSQKLANIIAQSRS